MVSQWIKTGFGTALYLTPSPQNHVRDTLSLRMSSLASSWKVKSVFCCLYVHVCCGSCNKRGVRLGGKVVVIFFHLFCCQLWVLFESFEVLHIRQLLTFCCLMISSIFIATISSNATIEKTFSECCFFLAHRLDKLFNVLCVCVCVFYLFFYFYFGVVVQCFSTLTSVLRNCVPDWRERWRRTVEENIRWLWRRRAKPKQGQRAP